MGRPHLEPPAVAVRDEANGGDEFLDGVAGRAGLSLDDYVESVRAVKIRRAERRSNRV